MSASAVILVLLRSLAMAAVGVVPLRGHWRRHRSMAMAGAAAWFVTVALKVGWALPITPVVHRFLVAHLSASWAERSFAGYVGILTGIFEVGLVFALARLVRRFRSASVDDALAFGLGFGGIEALVLAVGGLAGLAHPEAFVSASVLIGPFERASATMVHVVGCGLVMSPVFRARAWRAFALAFAFKSLVDGAAAFAVLYASGVSSMRLVAFELALGIVAMTAFLFLKRETVHRTIAT